MVSEGGSQGPLEEKCPPDKVVFDESRGQYVCLETGEVIEERVIDQGPEWRAFTSDEESKRARAGSPLSPMIHDGGLTSVIDWRDKDATGKKLEMKKRLDAMRWRKWQLRTRIQSSIDRNITQAAVELGRIADQLGLPKSIKEEAVSIYRRAIERGIVRGRSVEAVAAAALYIACRIHKIPRQLDEISSITKADKREISRCYRMLVKELEVKVPPTDSADYVPRIVSALGLSGRVAKKAVELLEEARKLGITAGKDPTGVAAAAVYAAAQMLGIRRTQKDIAAVVGVTEVTVRNRYRELVRSLKLQLPEE
ncbi:MAG: transcription initiation factor IIB [Sulfolobales archaeon]|nr:transcription initiation factor IIB [Sulfolobales archaeon]MDW8011165.1 transcription initiation factor IIB [Sulfolobales archaeon]